MLIDISYPYNELMAIYPNNPTFRMEEVQSLARGDGANVSLITMGTHTGTHIDAPSHFILGGKSIDQLELESMNGRAKLFDLRGNDEITKEVLEKCDIAADDIIIMKTDNTDRFNGKSILSGYVTLNYEAAQYLVQKKIKMVCIDYMTIERPREKRIQGKSIHHILLSNEILIVETIKLTNVTEGQYQLYCFPINIMGADGVPVRVVLAEL